MVEKLDLRKKYKDLYAPPAKEPSIVDVPELQFVMLDGEISAGETPETSPAFQEAFGPRYGITYTVKFMSKLRRENPLDYSVMAIEGLWWNESGSQVFSWGEGTWKWTLMILQPEHITQEMFQEAQRQLAAKRPNPAIERLRLARFHEGLSVQIMHIGPYADEPPNIARMHAFARERGYELHGKHHEIYLGDPRRARPEKPKTVLRQPIRPA